MRKSTIVYCVYQSYLTYEVSQKQIKRSSKEFSFDNIISFRTINKTIYKLLDTISTIQVYYFGLKKI